jgi:hypothetical protein
MVISMELDGCLGRHHPPGIRDSDRLHRLPAWDRRRSPPKLVNHRGSCASTTRSRASVGAVARSAHPGPDQARMPSVATSIRPLHAQHHATTPPTRLHRVAEEPSPRSCHRRAAPGPRCHASGEGGKRGPPPPTLRGLCLVTLSGDGERRRSGRGSCSGG